MKTFYLEISATEEQPLNLLVKGEKFLSFMSTIKKTTKGYNANSYIWVMVGPDDLGGFFQSWKFHDPVIPQGLCVSSTWCKALPIPRSCGTGAPSHLWCLWRVTGHINGKASTSYISCAELNTLLFWLKLSVLCLHRHAVTEEKWSWHCWVLAGWEPDWSEWAAEQAHEPSAHGHITHWAMHLLNHNGGMFLR